ncbi:MAG: protease-4 [Kiritimatiellia bacterium]
MAVVHLDGAIVMDKGSRRGSNIQARRVVPILRKLREDKDIVAVVLNINSPGGSALASDLMWREIDLMAKDKPVVAVFEDVSASGGFYLAAPAHRIVARPGTLTGSIGVFGGKLVVGEGLRRLGVHAQQVSESPNAHVYSPTRSFNQAQRSRFKASLQRFYDGFVRRVASGRKRPISEIEPHCRGRVWTGIEAAQHGLIDEFGDVRRGLSLARELAEVSGPVRRVDVGTQPRRNAMQWAMQRAMPGSASMQLLGVVEPLFRIVSGARSTSNLEVLLDHPGQAMAMMPFELELR